MTEQHGLEVRWDILPYISGNGLDLGCGDSRPHDWLVGVDKNPGTSQRGPNIIHDITKLELFADGSQDFVFSSHTLPELSDWPSVLKEWWRLIKDDGYLILYQPITETCTPKAIVDAMVPLRPWQFVVARSNDKATFHVYRKCNLPTILDQPAPEKVCAVVKLGAHGDALWASSVFPGLKEQGFHTILYTQSTGETMLRHDPHIDELINFENRVPMGELGELFQWLQHKYTDVRILVECVEGVSLPSPVKLQYHWPLAAREAVMNHNYLDIHHLVAKVPLFPKRMKFYPSEEEKLWANELRSRLNDYLVVVVPNGSGCSKFWPHTNELTNNLCQREDVTVVVLGDRREIKLDEHDNLMFIGQDWDIRKAMTFVQLSDVVVGQETGLVNCVGFEEDVHKIVLLTHSSEENLTRDWPNTEAIRMLPECAGTTGCHLLHYDWSHCNRDEATNSAKCQAMISADMVLEKIEPFICHKDTTQKVYQAA
jgi:hypothetical protein